MEKVIARETEIARELLQAKRKDRALLAIKKRKLQEAQLAQVDSWILNVDQMLGNIEQAAFTSKAVAALKEGSAQAKIIQVNPPPTHPCARPCGGTPSLGATAAGGGAGAEGG